MVAVDILTGYLGAGKTTLLRHALHHGLDARGVAIVVNELGEIGVDGTVLTGGAGTDAVVELTNGCVCCTIDEQRFDRALVGLVERTGAELVVIETTGVADPGPLIERLRRLGFGIDAVTAVVDASSFEERRRTDPVVGRQVAAADFVVIGKGDLVDAGTTARVASAVRRLNPRATRLTAERGRLDPSLLFATGVRAWRSPGPASGTASTAVESFAFRTSRPLDLDRFERLLATLPDAVIRAKGVVRVVGAGAHCVFNYTSGRHDLSWLRVPSLSESQAVFIGRGVRAHEASIRATLDACLGPEVGVSLAG